MVLLLGQSAGDERGPFFGGCVSKNLDDTWERLVNEFISKAARVDCSPGEYRDGLNWAIEFLQTEIAASSEMDSDGDEDS